MCTKHFNEVYKLAICKFLLLQAFCRLFKEQRTDVAWEGLIGQRLPSICWRCSRYVQRRFYQCEFLRFCPGIPHYFEWKPSIHPWSFYSNLHRFYIRFLGRQRLWFKADASTLGSSNIWSIRHQECATGWGLVPFVDCLEYFVSSDSRIQVSLLNRIGLQNGLTNTTVTQASSSSLTLSDPGGGGGGHFLHPPQWFFVHNSKTILG